MNVKCTIEMDGESFTASVNGDGDDEAVIGRAIAACVGAIGTIDGNLIGTLIVDHIVTNYLEMPRLMRSAALAHLAYDKLDDRDYDHWAIMLHASCYAPRPQQPASVYFVPDIEAVVKTAEAYDPASYKPENDGD